MKPAIVIQGHSSTTQSLEKEAEAKLYLKGGMKIHGRKTEKLKASAHKEKVTYWGTKTSAKMIKELSSMFKN